MAKWIKFTGSTEQKRDIRSAKNGADHQFLEYSLNPHEEKEKEFIEVRDYLYRVDGRVIKCSIRSDDVDYMPERSGNFIRWLDDDWVRIEV